MYFVSDVEDVKFVINYDYPSSSEDYVHRIGRTGRSSNTGTAYAFFTPNNAKQAFDLIAVLQEAKQDINPKLYQLAEMTRAGAFGGRSRFGRGQRGGGRGGRGSRFSEGRRGGSGGGYRNDDSRGGGGGYGGGRSRFSGGNNFGDSNTGGDQMRFGDNNQGFGRGSGGSRGGRNDDSGALFGRRKTDGGDLNMMSGGGNMGGDRGGNSGRGGRDRGAGGLRARQSRWGDKEDGGESKGIRTRRSAAAELNGASAGPAPLMASFQTGGQPNFNAPPPGYQAQPYGNHYQGSGGIPSLLNGNFNYQPVAGQPPLPRN